jgi:hypothetical protein
MRKDRLLELAKFLKTNISKKKDWKTYFNLGSWGVVGFKEKKCGSTACALGWSTVLFPNSGLELVKSNNDNEYELKYTVTTKFGLEVDRHYGWEAAAQFFGISYSQAQNLFSPWDYPNENKTHPKTVAKRIEDFVNAN